MLRKYIVVANVFEGDHLNIELTRVLNDNRWETWLQLVHRLLSVNLTNEEDRFLWNLST
jgi:hypothetical protein